MAGQLNGFDAASGLGDHDEAAVEAQSVDDGAPGKRVRIDDDQPYAVTCVLGMFLTIDVVLGGRRGEIVPG